VVVQVDGVALQVDEVALQVDEVVLQVVQNPNINRFKLNSMC
jgi:hypothetical protein